MESGNRERLGEYMIGVIVGVPSIHLQGFAPSVDALQDFKPIHRVTTSFCRVIDGCHLDEWIFGSGLTGKAGYNVSVLNGAAIG